MGRYSASKVRGANRESGSIVFRHPVKIDQYGKTGLRIYRGLGTTDEDKVELLISQMDEILSDPTLWDLSSREQAKLEYNEKILAAFYDSLEPRKLNYMELQKMRCLSLTIH